MVLPGTLPGPDQSISEEDSLAPTQPARGFRTFTSAEHTTCAATRVKTTRGGLEDSEREQREE